MCRKVNLIFPHQLFSKSSLLDNEHDIYLIEEYLFFKQYPFHKQKIAFHRATMRAYHEYLVSIGKSVHYIESNNFLADIRSFSAELKSKAIDKIYFIDPTDDWLEKRIREMSRGYGIEMYPNPQFLNTKEDLAQFFRPDKKSFFQTTFYKQQRKKRNILMEKGQKPIGGQWTFDSENRKKYPKSKVPPAIHYPERSNYWDEAVVYTEANFSENPGNVSKEKRYPITFQESNDWLEQFLTFRFFDFGAYEDAIVAEHSILNHSVLSPMMNVGLIKPELIVQRSIEFAQQENIPINSLEGFIRQIIGWREFIRGMYVCKGRYSRTRNFWKFDRKIPKSFYDGSTGIEPVDQTIKKLLQTGYCHHIERLMILGNFMLLCEFDPDEVYRWFMELFIDAYDWVMVPNVYGMCLFADGGTFATKPYISGSNYIKKMSDFGRGKWEDVWDGLFWQFIDNHQDFFRTNPRTSMLVHTFNRMSDERRKALFETADQFVRNKLNVG